MESLLPLILIIGVFYFLLIRPQQKRQRQHRELVQSIETGDHVVTAGGMYGFVDRLDDNDVWLRVAEGTVIRFSKGSIGRKIEPVTEEASSED